MKKKIKQVSTYCSLCRSCSPSLFYHKLCKNFVSPHWNRPRRVSRRNESAARKHGVPYLLSIKFLILNFKLILLRKNFNIFGEKATKSTHHLKKNQRKKFVPAIFAPLICILRLSLVSIFLGICVSNRGIVPNN